MTTRLVLIVSWGIGIGGLAAADVGAADPPPPAPGIDGPADHQTSPVPVPQPAAPRASSPGAASLPDAPAWTPPSTIAWPSPNGGTWGAGPAAGIGAFYAPGGNEPRVGSPYYYHAVDGGQYTVTGNPYYDHFGPGFQRHSLHGHYRFPYYNYRAPWYYPGRAVYNRDTNMPW
jgi:hypothetical protein